MLAKLLIVIASFHLAICLPQIPTDLEEVDDSHSSFLTYLCDQTQTNTLTSIFSTFDRDMPTILKEAKLGIASQYGFLSLFKSYNSVDPVTDLFQKITSKAKVTSGVVRYPVTFVCVNPGDRYTARKLAYASAHPDVPAASDSKSNDIFIFPFFWSLPVGGGRCPRLDLNTNHMSPNDGALVSNQWGTIVHELADKYLHFGETAEQAAQWPEVYNVQDAIDLPEGSAVMNAQSYAFFASGRSGTGVQMTGTKDADLDAAVKYICQNWPSGDLNA